MTMPTDKVTTLEAAIAAHVHDGDVVALQNMGMIIDPGFSPYVLYKRTAIFF